jgi:hypothetical protein
MPTHTLAWEGMYTPLRPWRFDTGYPQLTLYRGDDVIIAVSCAMRDGSALLVDGQFQRIAVNLTGAKLTFVMVPADPDDPDTTPIVKTNGTNGGIHITDPLNGLCTITLAAADTAAKTTTVYRAFLRAQWTNPDTTTTTGVVGQSPVFIIDPNETTTNFSFTATQ